MRLKPLFIAAILALSIGAPAAAGSPDQLDLEDPVIRGQLDAYIAEWIQENAGQVLADIQKHLEEEQARNSPQLAEFVSRADELIAPDAPHDGAELDVATVIAVEFFDFNCPYCLALHAEFKKLKAANPDIAFVYRDFPILQESSRTAAEAGRAAMKQGKYPEFADGIFSLPSHRIDEAGIVAVAEKVGLDMAQFAQDRASAESEAGVEKTFQQARSLKIAGTPFVFLWSPEHGKGAVIGGMAPADQIQPMIDALRDGQDVGAAR